MGEALGYDFNSVEITCEVYSPKAHSSIESDQEIIRQGLAKLFKGEISLPMDVKTFPADPQFIQTQLQLQQLLIDWLSGKQAVKITSA
jgi:hypothetical protein